MDKFEYYNPTRIVFGINQIKELDRLISKDDKVLVLYGGGSVEKNGTLEEALLALGNRSVEIFAGIEPNPQFKTLMKAVNICRSKEINFLLAVGGGSVIDGTKFVAAASYYDGDPWNILLTRGDCVKKAIPLGTILTIPATGSEMNCGSVINRSETKSKLSFRSPHVFPVFSILDPQKTLSLPINQVANGIVDAFVHILEQYITTPSNGNVQDAYSESLLKILIEKGPLIIKNPQDIDLRSNLMWVATMALNGLIGVGVTQDWTTHMIGHEITALYGIDHAKTLAIIIPGLWKICKNNKYDKLLQYAKNVWKIDISDDDKAVDLAIEYTENFFEELGIKTHLKDYDLNKQNINQIIDNLETHGLIALGEKQDITLEVSRKILENRI